MMDNGSPFGRGGAVRDARAGRDVGADNQQVSGRLRRLENLRASQLPIDEITGLLATDVQAALEEIMAGFIPSADAANSTTTALGAGETFTGEWVQNNDCQIAFNCLADQDGELFLEFSIDGTAALQTLSKRYEVFADQGEFDALVKMPGRYHRVRYVNGGVAQTEFGLLVSTALAGLYPYSVSDRDAPKFAASNAQSVTTEQYRILVDLSDRAQYPHNKTGRVDLHSVFFFIDKAANTEGQVQLGVITRIDGTDADVSFVQGVSFNSTSDRAFSRDRVFESPLSCGQEAGELTQVATGFTVTTTLVNTGLTLPTQFGTATPAVGDLVVRLNHAAGNAYNAAVSCQYSTSSSTT